MWSLAKDILVYGFFVAVIIFCALRFAQSLLCADKDNH